MINAMQGTGRISRLALLLLRVLIISGFLSGSTFLVSAVPDYPEFQGDFANTSAVTSNCTGYFNLLWWMIGRLSKLLGFGFAGGYQLLRIFGTVLFLILIYHFCAGFFQSRLARRTAFLVASLTSGFGWVLVVLKYTLADGKLFFPLDVYVAEGNTFLGIMGYPHFIAAGLYLGVFALYLHGQTTNTLRPIVVAGLWGQFLGWQHAYDLVLVYGIIGAYGLIIAIRDRRISH